MPGDLVRQLGDEVVHLLVDPLFGGPLSSFFTRRNASAERDSLQQHASTSHIRKYSYDDLARLARRLETEALNELNLYLAYVYRLGHHKMLIYPFRPSAHRAPREDVPRGRREEMK
jgi:hypothetical protein